MQYWVDVVRWEPTEPDNYEPTDEYGRAFANLKEARQFIAKARAPFVDVKLYEFHGWVPAEEVDGVPWTDEMFPDVGELLED